MEKNTNRKSVITLWLNNSKKGNQFLTGYLYGEKVIGFINKEKKNPNEPDIRIYYKGDTKKEILSLWCNVSKSKTKYLSGKHKDDRIICFFSDKSKDDKKKPYIFGFVSEPLEKKETESKSEESVLDNEVPF